MQEAAPTNLTKARELIKEALRQEPLGNNDERNRLLGQALELAPDYRPARWHNGYVWEDGEWVFYKEVPDRTANNFKVKEYCQMRADGQKNIDEQKITELEFHRGLGNWCQNNGLVSQARAHWAAVLRHNPDHSRALNSLGFKKQKGSWILRDQIVAANREAERVAKDLRQWHSLLVELRGKLNSPVATIKNEAREKLMAIRDPSVVPAIEKVLVTENPQDVRLAIAMLGNIKSHRATQLLARLAVAVPDAWVRGEAIEKLKSRDRYSYVPELLAATGPPTEAHLICSIGRCGILYLDHVISRGGQYLDVVRLGSICSWNIRRELKEKDIIKANARSRKILMRNLMARELNKILEEQDARARDALTQATGVQLDPNNARNWLHWWRVENGLDTSHGFGGPTYRQAAEIDPAGSEPRMCDLAPKTWLWTDRGLRHLESVEIGDRVLAQNPETGELGYQAVLQTIKHYSRNGIQLEADYHVFEPSDGHLFWVSGTGWQKACEIPRGTYLHCVDGTAEVTVNKQHVGNREMHNLVVDGPNTFCVGPRGALVLGYGFRKATEVTVPGLYARGVNSVDQHRMCRCMAEKKVI